MSLSLDAAISGMVEQQRNMEYIANNLANVNTTRKADGSLGAYRRRNVVFAPLMDQATQQLGGDGNFARVLGDARDRRHPQYTKAPANMIVTQADFRKISLGLRSITLDQSKDEWGEAFRFVETFNGLEVIPKAGTVIAYDGDAPVATPYDDCVLIMPSRRLNPGASAVRLGRYVSMA